MGVQGGGQDSTDLVTMHTSSFSVEDITAVLDTTLRENEEVQCTIIMAPQVAWCTQLPKVVNDWHKRANAPVQ